MVFALIWGMAITDTKNQGEQIMTKTAEMEIRNLDGVIVVFVKKTDGWKNSVCRAFRFLEWRDAYYYAAGVQSALRHEGYDAEIIDLYEIEELASLPVPQEAE